MRRTTHGAENHHRPRVRRRVASMSTLFHDLWEAKGAARTATCDWLGLAGTLVWAADSTPRPIRLRKACDKELDAELSAPLCCPRDDSCDDTRAQTPALTPVVLAPQPLAPELNAVCFSTPSTGIAVGDYGFILRTRMLVGSWSRVATGVNAQLKGVALNGAIGIAAGEEGVILRSSTRGPHGHAST